MYIKFMIAKNVSLTALFDDAVFLLKRDDAENLALSGGRALPLPEARTGSLGEDTLMS